MAAPFSKAANAPYRAVLACAVVTLAALVVAPMLYVRLPYAADVGDPVEQPIAFDHRHHVRDDGIDCVYCHDTVETQAFAGIPATERCMGCHAQVWVNSPELAPVRASWERGEPIRWKRVNEVPGYVYFHHGVHAMPWRRRGHAARGARGAHDDELLPRLPPRAIGQPSDLANHHLQRVPPMRVSEQGERRCRRLGGLASAAERSEDCR